MYPLLHLAGCLEDKNDGTPETVSVAAGSTNFDAARLAEKVFVIHSVGVMTPIDG
jgi:hypothetical protein